MQQLQEPDFSLLNGLVQKEPTHKLSDIKSSGKNFEFRLTVLRLVESTRIKRQDKIQRYLMADSSGSAFVNFFGQQREFQQGDTIYMTGAYASIYNHQLIVYQGKQGVVLRVGRLEGKIQLQPNFSKM